MDVDVTPAVGPAERRAVRAALELARVRSSGAEVHGQAWRLAGLREASGREDTDVAYALSPRSTRGATRA